MLSEMFADTGLRGNACIVQSGRILCEYSGGYADLANQIPNTAGTRFESASAGKAFVAAGILQLIERRCLRFDDTLGKILNMDLHRIDPDVTVEQLLTHTSGVPDYYDESVMQEEYEALWRDRPNYSIRHNSDMLPLFIDRPMMYPRGEKFQYNNSGYVLLAMIIEKVTGMEFGRYLKKHVFDVCGMTSTGYFAFDRLPAGCANCYIYCPETDDYRTNIYTVEVQGSGAGGAYITVGDIVRFWEGLISHTLLSGEMVSKMFSKQSGDGRDPEEGYYGYGMWIIDHPEGKDYVYFQGLDQGASFVSEYNPNNGMISVLASNYGDDVWERMRHIRKTLY